MQFKCSVHEEGINSTAAPTQCKCMQIRKAAEMSKSAEFWNCLYCSWVAAATDFQWVVSSCSWSKLLSKIDLDRFLPSREEAQKWKKKLRQKIRSLLLVVLLLKKPKHFARKKTTSRNREEDRLIIVSLLLLLLLLSTTAAFLFQFLQFCTICLGKYT